MCINIAFSKNLTLIIWIILNYINFKFTRIAHIFLFLLCGICKTISFVFLNFTCFQAFQPFYHRIIQNLIYLII